MDLGYFLGVTLIALLWLPALYALHAPPWTAAIVACVCLRDANVWLAAPVAALVCSGAAHISFRRAWRVQALAVALMASVWLLFLLLQAESLLPVIALVTGFSLGLFTRLTLHGSAQLFRAAAIVLLFLVVALHPGLWGATPFARLMMHEYAGALVIIVLFAVALQVGAGVGRRVAIQEARQALQVAREEFCSLMDRLIPPLPA